MSFWKNYYHLVWGTKYRQHCINDEMQAFIFATIQRLSDEALGSKIFAINGLPDHIHVAVAIPPRIAVSDWVKRVKGASSHAINKQFPNEATFAWQIKFGSSTFGFKQMSFVTSYIERQKEHHAQNTTYWYLERTNDEDEDDNE